MLPLLEPDVSVLSVNHGEARVYVGLMVHHVAGQSGFGPGPGAGPGRAAVGQAVRACVCLNVYV